MCDIMPISSHRRVVFRRFLLVVGGCGGGGGGFGVLWKGGGAVGRRSEMVSGDRHRDQGACGQRERRKDLAISAGNVLEGTFGRREDHLKNLVDGREIQKGHHRNGGIAGWKN